MTLAELQHVLAAIDADAPVAEIARRLQRELLDEGERAECLARALARRPILEGAALLHALGVDEVCAPWSFVEVLRVLAAAPPGFPRELLDVLARQVSAPRSSERDPELALVDLYARLCTRTSRPVRDAIPLASVRADVRGWAPVLRRHGLSASAVALHLVERDPPMPAIDIARTLQEAGYEDDAVLRALLENGVRSTSALRLLAEHGWSVDRMVASMLGRTMLLSEVRDHLLALEVRPEAIADVLLRHAPEDQVRLVVPDAADPAIE